MIRSTISSYTGRSTRMREPTMHDWPALAVNTPVRVTPTVAASRSASAKTMFGDFPPSSKWSCFRDPAAAAMRVRAVSVDPVKLIRATSR